MSADLFSDLGLAAGVAAAAEEAGFDTPTSIQEAAIPLLRRGNNMVVVGAPGSGARTAILLSLIDRLLAEGAATPDEEEENEGGGRPRALVLTATGDEAARVARSASRLGASSGIRARSLDRPDAWIPGAAIACASVGVAMDAIRGSALKLDALATVVIDGFDAIRALGLEEALDTVLGQMAAETQRVVRAAAPSPALDDFTQRAIRRAMRVPSRPADAKESPAPAAPLRGVELSLLEVPAGAGHDALATLAARGPVRAHFRSSNGAAAAARELTTRGFDLERLDATVTVPASLPSTREVEPLEVSFGAPADAATLGQRHRDGGILIVDPRELAHVRALAAESGANLRPSSLSAGITDAPLERFRAEVRRALDEEDLASQMLVLQPLMAEHSPAEVAAALSALLRARRPSADAAGTAARATGAGAPPPARSWTRLYIGIGKRDDVRAGDLVGAITGEANVTGEVIGKIDMRDTFSVVEVESGAAQHVIDSLNGRTLRGRAMRVDYDRRGEGEEPAQRARAGGGAERKRAPRDGGGGGGGRGPRGGGARGGGGGGRPPRGGSGGGQRGGGGDGGSRGSGGGRGGPGRGPARPGPSGPRRGPPRDRD